MERFGDKVKARLEQSGRNQAWLASQSGLAKSVVSRIVSGDRPATAEAITAVAGALGLDPGQLAAGTDAESRLAEASEWIRRGEFVAMAAKLAEYEARIHDLEQRLRYQEAAADRDSKRRSNAEAAAASAHLELTRSQHDLDACRAHTRELERDSRRHRDGLRRAVAEVSTLRQQLAAIADELRGQRVTQRTTTILAGVAAVAGVVTMAQFLRDTDDGDDDHDDE